MRGKWKLLLALAISLPLAAQLGGPNENRLAYVDTGGGFTLWNAVTDPATPPYPMRGINLWCQNGATVGHCNPSGGPGGSTSITSSDSSLTVNPSPLTGTGTINLNLAHTNIFTAAQTFNAGITSQFNGNALAMADATGGQGLFTVNLNQVGTDSYARVYSAFNNAYLKASTNSGSGVAALQLGTSAVSHNVLAVPGGAGVGLSDSVIGDTLLLASAGNRILIGTTGASNVQVSNAQISTTPKTITASATPAISATDSNLQIITLSANATPTIANIAAGQRIILSICQPATGGPFTWTWPAAFHGGMTIGTTASTCSQQAFDNFNGTTYRAENAGVANVAP
jgi:hypothetical protein